MGNLQHWPRNLPVAERDGGRVDPAVRDSVLKPQRSLRIELIIFLALLATFAAVLFRDVIVESHFRLDRYTIASFRRYDYADELSGGKSRIIVSKTNPLVWRCELRASRNYYPYCGYGIMLDVARKLLAQSSGS